MAMEQKIPSSEFDFNTGRASPFLKTPSSPKRFGEFFSVPSSPFRDCETYGGFDDLSFTFYKRGEASTSSSPLNWGGNRRPIEPAKSSNNFALETSTEYASTHSTPERFKDDKMLKPLPYGHGDDVIETIKSPLLSLDAPNSKHSRHKKSFWSTFSPKRKKEVGHYEAAMRDPGTRQERGRERVSTLSNSKPGRRVTRSLSPFRVSKYPWEEEGKLPQNTNQSTTKTKPSPITALSLSSSSKGSRKWRLRDFLLFRSASEGRALEKDPFKKYADMYRKHQASKRTDFKSADGTSIPAQRRGAVSAHELHYTVNKEISQDMRKKSFLPYKQGILGRLAVNPAVHALAYGFGSLPQNYG